MSCDAAATNGTDGAKGIPMDQRRSDSGGGFFAGLPFELAKLRSRPTRTAYFRSLVFNSTSFRMTSL